KRQPLTLGISLAVALALRGILIGRAFFRTLLFLPYVTSAVAAAMAWQLNRKVVLDPLTETFPGDPEANRLRFRVLREPWRL
ncbi:MAG: hypothetical protein N3B01_12650, partial [Verrucomicrobiae bacterium]|nr:hypothetical protein [Verrucomicrobiae bacterium]